MKAINFRDFLPQAVDTNMFGWPKTYESMKSVLAHVNAWIVEERIDVINIETVFSSTHTSANQPIEELEPVGPATSQWGTRMQVIRVWYKA